MGCWPTHEPDNQLKLRQQTRTPRICLILCEIFAFSLAMDSSNRVWLIRCVVTFGLRFCRSLTHVKGSGVEISSDPLPLSFQCRRNRLCFRRSVVRSQSTTGSTTQSGWFRLVVSGAKAVDIRLRLPLRQSTVGINRPARHLPVLLGVRTTPCSRPPNTTVAERALSPWSPPHGSRDPGRLA